MKKIYSLLFVLMASLAFAQAPAPTLYIPENATTVNGIRTELIWNDVTGETGYILQYDTANTFNSPNLVTTTTGSSNGTRPSITISNLAFGTTYYWRVASITGEAQSAWSAVRTFNSIAAPTLYIPENATTVNGITTELIWNDINGETGYVFQYDTVNTFNSANLVTNTTGASDGTRPRVIASNLAFGTTYYWRVAAVNGEAQSAWSVVRTFNTTAAPTLYIPENATAVNGITTELIWNDINGETGYVFQYDTVNTFNSANLVTNTTGASNGTRPRVIANNLAFGTTYYWRVAAVNGEAQSAWSAVRTFNTIAAPTLYLPENATTINGLTTELIWNDINGETGYIYQYDTESTFNSANLVTNTIGASDGTRPRVTANSLSLGTTYYWRVAALNGDVQSAWSVVRAFYTIGAPALYSPDNTSTVNGIAVDLVWNDVTGETGYVYQLDTATTFNSASLISATTGASNGSSRPRVTVNNLSFGTTYYWRVAMMNGSIQSGWSEARSFTTIASPSLYLPENTAIEGGINTNLVWNDVAGETGYIYQYDTVNTFDSPGLVSRTMAAHDNSSRPRGTATNLTFGTTYYWRVAILNGTAQSEWSLTRNFTVRNGAILYEPASGSVNMGTAVSFKWYDIEGETGFILQLDTTNTFDSPQVALYQVEPYTSNTFSPIRTVSNLSPNTTYYWRVAILAGGIQSAWSSAWVFSTGATIAGTQDIIANAFNIYPNPAKDLLNFSNVPDNANFTINSIEGRAVLSGKANINAPLNLSNLPTGIYLITIEKDGKKELKKFIKQ